LRKISTIWVGWTLSQTTDRPTHTRLMGEGEWNSRRSNIHRDLKIAALVRSLQKRNMCCIRYLGNKLIHCTNQLTDTSVGWQITLCDPIDKWRPAVLRWISRRTIHSFTFTAKVCIWSCLVRTMWIFFEWSMHVIVNYNSYKFLAKVSWNICHMHVWHGLNPWQHCLIINSLLLFKDVEIVIKQYFWSWLQKGRLLYLILVPYWMFSSYNTAAVFVFDILTFTNFFNNKDIP